MLRVFDKVEGWSEKVNFVDSNNNVLGYDMAGQCCEYATWAIVIDGETIEEGSRPTPFDIEGVVFSGHHNQVGEGVVTDPNEVGYGYGGNSTDNAFFELVDAFTGKPRGHVHISNSHNGYYAHGFHFNGPAGDLGGSL